MPEGPLVSPEKACSHAVTYIHHSCVGGLPDNHLDKRALLAGVDQSADVRPLVRHLTCGWRSEKRRETLHYSIGTDAQYINCAIVCSPDSQYSE